MLVCQLRRETADGDGYSMVAFQTRLTISAQQSVVRLIPGLENAEFCGTEVATGIPI